MCFFGNNWYPMSTEMILSDCFSCGKLWKISVGLFCDWGYPTEMLQALTIKRWIDELILMHGCQLHSDISSMACCVKSNVDHQNTVKAFFEISFWWQLIFDKSPPKIWNCLKMVNYVSLNPKSKALHETGPCISMFIELSKMGFKQFMEGERRQFD